MEGGYSAGLVEGDRGVVGNYLVGDDNLNFAGDNNQFIGVVENPTTEVDSIKVVNHNINRLKVEDTPLVDNYPTVVALTVVVAISTIANVIIDVIINEITG